MSDSFDKVAVVGFSQPALLCCCLAATWLFVPHSVMLYSSALPMGLLRPLYCCLA